MAFIWCAAPRNLCWSRVEGDQNATHQRTQARLRFINNAQDQWFEMMPDESAREVLGYTVDQCRECCRVLEVRLGQLFCVDHQQLHEAEARQGTMTSLRRPIHCVFDGEQKTACAPISIDLLLLLFGLSRRCCCVLLAGG